MIVSLIAQMPIEMRNRLPRNPTFRGKLTPGETEYLTREYRSAMELLDGPKVPPRSVVSEDSGKPSVPSINIFGPGNTAWHPVKGGGYSVTNLQTGQSLAVSDEGDGSYAAMDLNSGQRFAIADDGDGTFSVLELK
jgi:hypothetical protein